MAPPAFKRPVSVLVVVHCAGQVLLLERRSPPGFWQSVTGSLEGGESPADAAARELAEETGLTARGLANLGLVQRFPVLPEWSSRFGPDVRENVEYAFALELPDTVEPALRGEEHLAFRWLGLESG
jgi:dATP pyrophosphohydrolase